MEKPQSTPAEIFLREGLHQALGFDERESDLEIITQVKMHVENEEELQVIQDRWIHFQAIAVPLLFPVSEEHYAARSNGRIEDRMIERIKVLVDLAAAAPAAPNNSWRR